MRIDLNELLEEALAARNDDEVFYNLNSGQFIWLTDDMSDGEIRDAENELDSHYSEYVQLPDRYDLDERSILYDFAAAQPKGRSRDTLYASLKGGAGVFSRWNNAVKSLGLRQEYNEFRMQSLLKTMSDWAKANHLDVMENSGAVYKRAQEEDIPVLVALKKEAMGCKDSEDLDFEMERYYSWALRKGEVIAFLAKSDGQAIAMMEAVIASVCPSKDSPRGKLALISQGVCLSQDNEAVMKQLQSRLEAALPRECAIAKENESGWTRLEKRSR